MAVVTDPSGPHLRVYRAVMVTPVPVTGKNKLAFTKEKIPWWRSEVTGTLKGQAFWNIDRGGMLSGSVETDGVLTPYAAVHLYYMPNGILIEKTLCDAGGFFSFSGLDRNSNKYAVVAYIPPLQALIFDQLTPV